MFIRKFFPALVCSTSLALIGCQAEDSASTESSTTTDSSTTQQASSGTSAEKSQAAVGEVSDISELKLSSAFNVALPGALEAKAGAGLRLVDAKKSQEACQMGQTIRQVTDSLREVSGFFCHIEIEKDKLVFGAKTMISFQGQEFAKIWVDDSEMQSGNKIRIGFCSQHGENESNSELIEITSLSASGPKGSIINKGSFTNDQGSAGAYHRAVEFDMTTAGTSNIKGQDSFSMGSDKYTREVVLSMVEDGISSARSASKGSWQGQTFQERGYALFDGAYGAAAFENSGTHESQTFAFSRLAYFDADGYVVPSTASASFEEGGNLYVNADSLPEYLAADFAPSDLDGWVAAGCPDYDKEVELNPESPEHQACDGDRGSDQESNCWDQTQYEAGSDMP